MNVTPLNHSSLDSIFHVCLVAIFAVAVTVMAFWPQVQMLAL